MLFCKKTNTAAIAAVTVFCLRTTRGDSVYVDHFTTPTVYTYSTQGGADTVSDESYHGDWKAGGGAIVYARPSTGVDPNQYRYASSLILTNGSTPTTGSTAGLTVFTVATTINTIFAVNTAQPGLVITGSAASGGYLLAVDNGQNSDFVLIAETGAELLGDEGSNNLVADFGHPTIAHQYSISVTENREGAYIENLADPLAPEAVATFEVSIFDMTANSSFYSGSVTDAADPGDFGGTQIGYRIRDPLDADRPSFGPLSLSVPEPGGLGLPATALLFLLRRKPRL